MFLVPIQYSPPSIIHIFQHIKMHVLFSLNSYIYISKTFTITFSIQQLFLYTYSISMLYNFFFLHNHPIPIFSPHLKSSLTLFFIRFTVNIPLAHSSSLGKTSALIGFVNQGFKRPQALLYSRSGSSSYHHYSYPNLFMYVYV